MEQSQVQTQKQQQVLKQTTSVNQMQLLQARLAELPVTQLADCIKTELDDNPALEAMQPDDHYDDHEGTTESGKPCFTIVEHSDLYEAFDF